jgi:hypothetical protein
MHIHYTVNVQSQKHGNFYKIKSDLEIRASGVLIIMTVVFFDLGLFYMFAVMQSFTLLMLLY